MEANNHNEKNSFNNDAVATDKTVAKTTVNMSVDNNSLAVFTVLDENAALVETVVASEEIVDVEGREVVMEVVNTEERIKGGSWETSVHSDHAKFKGDLGKEENDDLDHNDPLLAELLDKNWGGEGAVDQRVNDGIFDDIEATNSFLNIHQDLYQREMHNGKQKMNGCQAEPEDNIQLQELEVNRLDLSFKGKSSRHHKQANLEDSDEE